MAGEISVENFNITIASGSTTGTDTLTKSQTAANCIPFVTFRSARTAGEQFHTRFARCTISGSTVTLTRNSQATFDLEYHVSVVEYDPSLIDVQTDEVTMTGTSQTDTLGTTFTDISDVFMLFQHTTTDATDDLDALTVRGQVTNTTTLTFTRGNSANAHTIRWYSAEALSSEFSVQRDSFTISGSTASATDTITSVTEAKTFLIASTSETGETSDDWRDGVGRADLQSATLVRFRRGNGGTPTGATITMEYQAVSFSGGEAVSRGEFSITGTSDTDTVSLTADESTAWSPMIFGRGEANSTNGDDFGQMHAQYDFTSDTVIRGRVVTDSTNGLWSWEAIEWEFVTYEFSGVTRDNAGSALGSCDVYAVEEGTPPIPRGHTTSNATTGAYTFLGLSNADDHIAIAFKDGSPNVMDVTDPITPTET